MDFTTFNRKESRRIHPVLTYRKVQSTGSENLVLAPNSTFDIT